MISLAVAQRYAKALVEVAFEENIEHKVTEDLRTYEEIFHAVPGLLDTLHNPAVTRTAKERLLHEIMARYPVDGITSNFLRVLLRHNRIRFFTSICEAYEKLVSERKGMMHARVTTAEPLSETEVLRLAEKLGTVTGKQVKIDLETDSEILGGVIVQMGSTVYDGSVRTRLTEMRRLLAES